MGIWVGRYAMVAGEVREHGPWLVERRRVDDEQSVRLLVLAEPVDERSAEFCHEVADAVAELFAGESLSITGGLLRALRQAHANLAEWNRRSLREHQVAVGLTCVAIRDGEATVAQAGPSTVYLSHAGALQRLSTEGEPSALPVGGPAPVEPRFRSVPMQGSELLLLTAEAERALGPLAIRQALSGGPERALAELFVRTREFRDMTAVLVAEREGADDTPFAPVDFGPPGESDTGGPQGWLTAAGTAEAETRLSPAEQRAEPAARRSVDSGAQATATAERARSFPSLRHPRVAGRRSGRVTPRLPWRTLGLLAAGVAVVTLLVLFVLPPLLEQDRGERLQQAVAAAQLQLDGAEAAGEAAARRAALDAALLEVERARSIAPQDERVAALEQRAAAVLAALDAVHDAGDLREVLAFEGNLTAPLEPAALVAGGGSLWLLDAERGRVFALDPRQRERPREAYRAGETYGGVTGGVPLALTWDAAGGRLLLLDAGRALFALPRDGEPRPVPLRNAAEIGAVTALASYSGNLYLLDPAAGEVWRYLPAAEGYDSERGALLGGVEIEGAQALAVDGDLFVLQPSRLRHFRLGQELPSLLRGVDAAPETVAGLAQDAARDRLYVADRGGRRILVSSRAGEFIAQYRHAQFFDLRGLALSESGAELYVLTGDGIFAFDPLR